MSELPYSISVSHTIDRNNFKILHAYGFYDYPRSGIAQIKVGEDIRCVIFEEMYTLTYRTNKILLFEALVPEYEINMVVIYSLFELDELYKHKYDDVDWVRKYDWGKFSYNIYDTNINYDKLKHYPGFDLQTEKAKFIGNIIYD